MHSIELECPTTRARISREVDSEVQPARNAKAKSEMITARIGFAAGN
jgi:hypothetical protein